jgi:hypothetical protein
MSRVLIDVVTSQTFTLKARPPDLCVLDVGTHAPLICCGLRYRVLGTDLCADISQYFVLRIVKRTPMIVIHCIEALLTLLVIRDWLTFLSVKFIRKYSLPQILPLTSIYEIHALASTGAE